MIDNHIIDNNNFKSSIFQNNIQNQEGINILRNQINSTKQNLTSFEKELLSDKLALNENAYINILKSEKENLIKENQEKDNNIKKLNYQIIELNQKISSNESTQKIIDKISTNKNIKNAQQNMMIEKFKIEIIDLQNKINELEIKNSKLLFDNESLLNKIKLINSEKINESNLKNLINQKKIDYFYKQIEFLNSKLNNEIEKNKNVINNISSDKQNNDLINANDIYDKFNEMRKKILDLDEENFLLQKENQNVKNINEELQIIIKGKDEIISRIQNNIINLDKKFNLEKSYNININESKNNNEPNANIDKKNKYKEMANVLLLQNEKMNKENNELKINIKKLNQEKTEFSNKENEYEKVILIQEEKLKEYKYKISILKIKINELHQELMYFKGGVNNTNLNKIGNTIPHKEFNENNQIKNNNNSNPIRQVNLKELNNNKNRIMNNKINSVDINHTGLKNDINKLNNKVNPINDEVNNKNNIKISISDENSNKKINNYNNVGVLYDNSFNRTPGTIREDKQEKKIDYPRKNNKENFLNESINKISNEYEDNNNIEEIEENESEDEKKANNILYSYGKKDNNNYNNSNNDYKSPENNVKLTNTQDFINNNINDDKKQLQFIQEYRDILNKIDENINVSLNKVKGDINKFKVEK